MANREPSPGTPCSSPSLPAERDADGLPVEFDRECDHEIPRRLFCSWKEEGKPREVVRALTAGERAKLDARAAALEQALRYLPDEERPIKAELAAMFSGFRSMRQQGEDIAATVEITRGVLRQFPLWAIAKGCMKIAQGRARLDRRYAPNDAEINKVIAGIVRPYCEAIDRARALLLAPVAEAPRSHQTAERVSESPLESRK